MNPRHGLLLALGLTLLAAAADLTWHLPRLPERLATHFNAESIADGWSHRDSYVVMQAAVLLLLPAVFAGLAFLVPRLPTTLINLPHREYWLAPVRRDVSLAVLSRFLLLVGLLITGFLVGLMHLILRANLQPAPRLGSGFAVLSGLQILGLLAALGWLFWRFRKPRAA
jgi:uncharacterized membrane protein YqjE